MESTAPQPTEGRYVAWWLPLVILVVAFGLAAGLGVMFAHLHF